MRTIEKDKTIVEVIIWPRDRAWPSRYATSCTVDSDLSTLVLTEQVFRNTPRANTAYKRLARRMEQEGLNPPNIIFREMSSIASKDTFCLLSPTQSLFNTACPLGKLSVMDIGADDKRMLCAISSGAA